MSNSKISFEEIFAENERRIHFHIHRLNLTDPHQEFYQEGLCALWHAYESYQPDKGTLATYFNYTIRNRMIDLLRKQVRQNRNDEGYVHLAKTMLEDGNRLRKGEVSYPVVRPPEVAVIHTSFWEQVKSKLTSNQWKWVEYYIIERMSIKEIAAKEGVSADAVKSWGREVRKKLRAEHNKGNPLFTRIIEDLA